jgi:hypothetical protein
MRFVDQTVHDKGSGNLKHITIILCVLAGSACLVPSLVIAQSVELIWLGLEERDMRAGRDLILMHRQKPSINGKLQG